MKRQFIFIILSLFLLASCSKGELLPTDIKVKAESVTGSRARFTVAPENPYAYYTYVLLNQQEEDFNASPIDICNNDIKWMEDCMQYFEEEGSFTDIFCYQGNRQLTMKTLASDNDFKFIVYQINPKTHKLIGEPIVNEFHTKPVPQRDLHFQVEFNGDRLEIKPSDDNLTYFFQYEESDMIYNYYRSASNYLYQLVGLYQEYGFIDFCYYRGTSYWDFSVENNMVDGRNYALVIAGCEDGEFTTPTTIVKFKYHPGNIEILEIIEGSELTSQRKGGVFQPVL